MRKELLRISHVSMERDGEQLLDNLEFRMFAGEIFGLVARNRKGQKEMVDLTAGTIRSRWGLSGMTGRS